MPKIGRIIVLAVGLILLPIVINFATSGVAPAYTWPLVGVLGAVAVGVGVHDHLRRGGPKAPGRVRPGQYERASGNVRRYVTQRLDQSLVRIARARLDLDAVSGAVGAPPHSWHVRRGEDAWPSSAATTPLDVYDHLDGSMLILGAPGAGKTTMILELAEALLDRPDAPLPVVLELSDWARPRRVLSRRVPPDDLRKWLFRRIEKLYGIGDGLADAWLADGRLALLIDGFDEVPLDHRNRCVAEVNALYDSYPQLSLVIGSRADEYHELPESRRFRLRGAVSIRPLTATQVVGYLAEGGPRLRPTRDAVMRDPGLLDLITAPFWLFVLIVAVAESNPGTAGWNRDDLLASYVQQVFRGPRRPLHRFREAQVLRWMPQLARVELALNTRTLPGRRPGLGSFGWWWALPPDLRSGLGVEGVATAMAIWSAAATAVLVAAEGVGWGVVAALVAVFWLTAGAWMLGDRAPAPLPGPVRLRCRLCGALLGLAGAALIVGMGWAGSLAVPWPARTAALCLLLGTALMLVMRVGGALRKTATWSPFFGACLAAHFAWSGTHLVPVFVGIALGLCIALLLVTTDAAVQEPSVTGFTAGLPTLLTGAAIGLPAGLLWGPGEGGSYMTPTVLLLSIMGTAFVAALPVTAVGGLVAWLLLVVFGLLPVRHRRFMEHTADLGLLRRDGRGYRFPHLILTEHLAREADRPPRRSSPA
ncbi:NACHT domain-containing protein [Herbidospora daliensis]|uniref:NACHT domain-containing protein n=1 Tax=Herbidospora daliensis TaxID=295585 RepID=UPI000781B26E|nr:hypothetical protein [Herbidospora daliensis]